MDGVEVVSGHPYRNKPISRAPQVSGRARKLAAHGASIVLVCLLFRGLGVMWTEVVFAAEVLLMVGTWLFTWRCAADNRVARALGVLLRILATVDSALVIGNSLQLTSLPLHAYLSLTTVPVVGLLFLAARLHSFGLPNVSKKLVTLLAMCAGSILCAMAGSLVTPFLSVPFMITAFSSYVALWLWGAALMIGVRRTLLVDAHEWWLNVEALPRVEWTSYARLRDGRVEVVGADGGTRWFDNTFDAIFWLDRAGFCPQEQALAQGLVDQPPTRSLVQVPRAITPTRPLAQSY